MIALKKGGDSMYLKRKIDEYLLEWKEKEERRKLIFLHTEKSGRFGGRSIFVAR